MVCFHANASASIIVVDFNSAMSIQKGETIPGGDFDLYEEDGFLLFATSNGGNTQMGQVRINDSFTTSLAAYPNFGFDDQDILVSAISGSSFDFLSLDIYEATIVLPSAKTLFVEGIRESVVVVSQMFITDGIAGIQTFALDGFTNLDKVRLGGVSSSETVGVDNLTFEILPEPISLFLFGVGLLAIKSQKKKRG